MNSLSQPSPWTQAQQQALSTAPNSKELLAGPSDFTNVGQKFYAGGTTAEEAAFFLPKAEAAHRLNKEIEGGDPHRMLAALSLVAVRGAQQSLRNQALAPKEERQEYRNRIRSVKQINALSQFLKHTEGEVGVARKFSYVEDEASDHKRDFVLDGHANSAGSTNVTFVEKVKVNDTVEDRPLGTITGIGEDGKLLIENPAYTLWAENRSEGTPVLDQQPQQFLDAASDQSQTILKICDGVCTQIIDGNLNLAAAAVGIRREAA